MPARPDDGIVAAWIHACMELSKALVADKLRAAEGVDAHGVSARASKTRTLEEPYVRPSGVGAGRSAVASRHPVEASRLRAVSPLARS
jgi:hypothetical protein